MGAAALNDHRSDRRWEICVSDNGKTGALGSPRVTIIVSPRERFGVAQKSLDSIYAASDVPFDLVYVDARSPARLTKWLKAQAPIKGFKHIHLDRFVTPTEARNIGLAESTTDYVVFIDNDVFCADGWLSVLVKCADETGADVIAPLVCDGLPLHSRVHQASGAFAEDKDAFFSLPEGQREIIDLMVHHGVPLERVRDQLHRGETDVTEFHCVMVRRSIFDRIGPLDEAMYATKEHFDFCMSVLQAGGKIVFEPESVVTYVFPTSANPITREDLPYFLLRWSPEWQIRSLEHLKEKWGLKDVGEFNEVRQSEHLRVRHYEGFVRPVIRKLPVISRSYRLTQAARKVLTNYADFKVRRLLAEYDKQRAEGLAMTTTK